MYAVYTIFPFGEMFLIMPGSRQGLDRFKAPGLMQSGMRHLIDQTYSLTYRVAEFWRDPQCLARADSKDNLDLCLLF